VKDRDGDSSDPSNYRGVTLSNIVSKLFEKALRLKFAHHLNSDDLQFGFKSQHSTSHAIFSLKTCVDHYTEKGSNVYVAFCNFTIAFDSMSHHGLFVKLMDRSVPLCFLLIVIFWYSSLCYNSKWGSTMSGYFEVTCGTKQGGILSPKSFSVYVNNLIL
jgi:hypothetical protein